jgi:hypothetical protein
MDLSVMGAEFYSFATEDLQTSSLVPLKAPILRFTRLVRNKPLQLRRVFQVHE